MANETADEIEIRILVRLDDDGKLKFREGGTLTDEPMAEPKPEPKPEPALVTWRRCVRMAPGELNCQWFLVRWFPSAGIPEHWYPIESHGQPVETVQQLPEGQEPKPEPKPKLVTWLRCVRIQPREIDGYLLCTDWFPSGSIPEDWYPIESHTQPVETVKELPEGQKP